MGQISLNGGIGADDNYGYGSKTSRDKGVDLKQAIKDYRDEQLTGLTDDERAEIDRLLKEYLEKNPIKNDADKAGYLEYYKSLLVYFGFKGDIDEMLAEQSDTAGDLIGAASGTSGGSTGYSIADARGTSEIITEPNGDKFLMFVAEGGRTVYFKIGTGESDNAPDPIGDYRATATEPQIARNLDNYERGMIAET